MTVLLKEEYHTDTKKYALFILMQWIQSLLDTVMNTVDTVRKSFIIKKSKK